MPDIGVPAATLERPPLDAQASVARSSRYALKSGARASDNLSVIEPQGQAGAHPSQGGAAKQRDLSAQQVSLATSAGLLSGGAA
jgi:hypothetical protein